MSERNIFYVYRHRRASDGLVFYIGKGTARRAYAKFYRSSHWHRTKNKHGIIIEIVRDNMPEQCSFSLEKMLIDTYRKSGHPIVNHTDGGEGSYGFKHSEESLEKMSGKNNWAYGRKGKDSPVYGLKHSQETKDKLRAMKTGSKLSEEHKRNIGLAGKGKGKVPIRSKCGLEFEGIIDAAEYIRSLGLSDSPQGSIKSCLGGRSKSAFGYVWEYIKK